MKLYETTYSVYDGLKPVKIKGKIYNVTTSELISIGNCGEQLRMIYRKPTGECWLYMMIPSIGHYISPLTEEYAQILIKQNEDSIREPFAFPTSLSGKNS